MASLTFLCLSLPLSEAGIPVGPLWGLRSNSAGVWLCWSSGATGPASCWAEVLRELAPAIWRHAPLAPARPENPPGNQVLGSGRRQPRGPHQRRRRLLGSCTQAAEGAHSRQVRRWGCLPRAAGAVSVFPPAPCLPSEAGSWAHTGTHGHAWHNTARLQASGGPMRPPPM